MDTNITIPKKEIAPGVFSTGGVATMPTVNPIQPNVITPQALQPVAPINLAGTTPAPIVDTSLVANATQGTQAFDTNAEFQRQLELQKQTTPDQTPLNDILASLTASEQGLTGRGNEQLNAETSAGIPEAQKTRATLQGTIKSQLAEYTALKTEFEKMSADIEAGAGRKGLTTGAVMGQQGAVDRAKLARLNSKASEIGLLQAQDQALAGQIETAQNTVNRAIDLKYQDKEAEYQIKKLQYDRIKDSLTLEEKKRGEAMQNALKKEETMLAEQKANEKTIENMLIQAQVNQAPLSVLNKAQALAKNGASKVDIAKSLGQYSLSVADRLDIRLKETQINKLNQEISQLKKIVPDAGELVKINGKDYIRYKDGTISEPVVPEAGDRGMVVTRLDEKLKTVDKLTKPSVGLSTSAGSLRGAPIPFLYKNAINDWRADAVNIIQKLTVDELGRVKSDGVTFGALSNGERQAVGEAATALGAASIKDKEGNPTGRFKMSEKKVRDEFQKIYDGYALDFERRAGVPYETYKQNPEALKVQAVDDFIDNTGTALQANYGNYPTN